MCAPSDRTACLRRPYADRTHPPVVQVIGHKNCGGVQSLMQRGRSTEIKTQFVDKWMEFASQARPQPSPETLPQTQFVDGNWVTVASTARAAAPSSPNPRLALHLRNAIAAVRRSAARRARRARSEMWQAE